MSLSRSKKLILGIVMSAIAASSLSGCGDSTLDGEWKRAKTPSPEPTEINIEAVTQASTEAVTETITETDTKSGSDTKADDDSVYDNTSDGTDYSVCSDFSEDEVEGFASDVLLAAANEEWDKFADYIEYPITINDNEYSDKESFLNAVNTYGVSRDFVNEILNNTDVNNLFAKSTGIMLGNGEIWINDRQDGSGLGISSLNFFFLQQNEE